MSVAGSEAGEGVEMARDDNHHESGEADDTDPEEDVVTADETVLQEEQKNVVMMMDHNDQAERSVEDEMEVAAIELEDLLALMQVCRQIPLCLISHICGS